MRHLSGGGRNIRGASSRLNISGWRRWNVNDSAVRSGSGASSGGSNRGSSLLLLLRCNNLMLLRCNNLMLLLLLGRDGGCSHEVGVSRS